MQKLGEGEKDGRRPDEATESAVQEKGTRHPVPRGCRTSTCVRTDRKAALLGGGQQLSDSGPWVISVRDGKGEVVEMKMEPAMSDPLVMDRWLTLSREKKAF